MERPDTQNNVDERKPEIERKTIVFDIEITKKTISELIKEGRYSWANPLIDDLFFRLNEENLGKWEVEICESSKSISLRDADNLCSQEGMRPGTIWHLLVFGNMYPNEDLKKPLVATGTSTLDDFECRSCPVLSGAGSDRKVGLGNWRGNKLKECCFLRVRRKIN